MIRLSLSGIVQCLVLLKQQREAATNFIVGNVAGQEAPVGLHGLGFSTDCSEMVCIVAGK